VAPSFVRTRRPGKPEKKGRGERAEKSPKPELTAIERALKLIAFRSRTGRELDLALQKRKVPPDERAAALARMRELGYIDDASLAGARARGLISKGDSPRLVSRRLQMQGIAASLSDAAAKDAAEGQTDDELAVQALAKRLRGRPVRDEKDRQRLMRALVQHGHRPGSVAKALKLSLDSPGDVDEDGE
jgi:regulatory protein